MRVMSLDVGTKTIGIAVSDLMGIIANGVETIHRTSKERDYKRLAELIKEHEVDTLVLGYPKNMNGSVGERAQICEAMAAELKELFPDLKDVVLWDERLSTVAATRVMVDADISRKKRKKVVDMMAAVVILQNYLDSKQFKARL
ncbi:MAG: Holliday junction resolvase RuvX [Phascolarctobacterium sp.]|nr:Holliday junction resolvase RuvX [Phascolarctobacterium sp.]